MTDPINRLNAALEGRYEVDREIGEGGMATVFLARDLKHNRNVALKVLKPELAAVVGAERFLAEIETTANLNHPHILPLFDSGEADSFLFYVMPLVEGETLRERIDRERQLPVEEAVSIAASVAKALQHAHDRGVIHRDIKPGNILIQDGQPMVSDFGIALAIGSAGGTRLTETGLSVGTPYYMSPEQATGDQVVGPATDLYALGAVLYEMLTGDPPYVGSTAQAILGKIIQGVPVSAKATRQSVPANVDAAIRKALEKIPADRFLDAGDFARALAQAGFRYDDEVAATGGAVRGQLTPLGVGLGVIAVLSSLLAGALILSRSQPAPLPVVRYTMPVGEGEAMYLGSRVDADWGWPSVTSLAFAPDGESLVYSATSEGPDETFVSQLYVRPLGQERAVPIEGTENGASPFFSPDGRWIGYFSGSSSGSSLRRVSLEQGVIETIVQGVSLPPTFFQATWGDDDFIVYPDAEGLQRVAASGGEPEVIRRRDAAFARETVGHPHSLPSGATLLFARTRSPDPRTAQVLALDLATGNEIPLLSDGVDPRYFAETEHLLFMRRGTLMAVGFDADKLELVGDPFVLAEGVMQALSMPNSNWETGLAQLAVSRSGHIAYASGGVYPPRLSDIVRVRFDGTAEPMALPAREYGKLRVSPDGDRIALSVRDGRASSLFIHDLTRRTTERLPTGGFVNRDPEWSPDRREVSFFSDGESGGSYRMPVDGSGAPERLRSTDETFRSVSWSSEGVIALLKGGDIWTLAPDGDPTPFVTSAALEVFATFSPDGRRMAYTSNQTGRDEVYVRPYPGPGAATLVSEAGGLAPAWSRDGRRLFFRGVGGEGWALMVSEIEPGVPLRVSPPVTLIEMWPYSAHVPTRAYDVLDDSSFVAVRFQDDDPTSQLRVDELRVVLNFVEELRARARN